MLLIAHENKKLTFPSASLAAMKSDQQQFSSEFDTTLQIELPLQANCPSLSPADQVRIRGSFALCEYSPIFGIAQVAHGIEPGLAFSPMKKQSRIDEELWLARQVLAINLRRALAKKLAKETNRPVALSNRTGVGKSVISRLLKPKDALDPYPTLETLVRIANGLGIGVFELVIDASDMRDLGDREIPTHNGD